jgi:NAD(P)-dependent dehydrogenase (short-subunit alcohol dehydrogenase family)
MNVDEAERAASELRKVGHDAFACAADVTRSDRVAQMTSRLEKEVGPLWLLVANAGTFHAAPTIELSEQQWDQEFDVDAKAVFLCSQAAVRAMIPRKAGRVIVVSSIAGLIVRTGQIGYCSAKAASIHFARCLAVEMAPHGITVNCICPGMTDSEMLRQSAAARGVDLRDYEEMIPSGRLARAEDHASTVAWLASDEAAHITGQVISVDGGQSLYHPLTRRA